jgi:DNA-binding GntR family transcriptional regulator
MPRARMQPAVKTRLLESVSADESDVHDLTGGDLVVEKVRQWVFEGILRDGDTLSQDDLADVLGLSRIPVRDGLIALEAAGWVRMVPGVGATAVGLDGAAIGDCFELFVTLWRLMIQRAVQGGGEFQSLLGAIRSVQQAQTPEEMAAANEEFVAALCEVAGAPRLEAAFHNAGRIVPRDFFSVVPEAVEVQRRSVPAIGRAVVRGDAKRATTLAVAQHRAHAKNLIRLLSERNVLRDEGPGRSLQSRVNSR